MLAVMSAQNWVGRLAAIPPETPRDTSPGAGGRLLGYLDRDDGRDARRRLRAEALRGFGSACVSDRIRVMQYPPLDLARHYPAVRPLTG